MKLEIVDMKWTFLICCLITLSVGEARKISRCNLIRELRRQDFPEKKLRHWVCLVEHESGRLTDMVSKRNPDGSRDHGLFQINDKYWCSNSRKPGKECNVTCKQLHSNNISKAVSCAKKIYQIQGFNGWPDWKNHCKGKSLPFLGSCKK